MAIIQVTPELLTAKANEVRSLIAEHDDAMAKLNTLISGLNESWRGLTQDAYAVRFSNARRRFSSFSEELKNYADLMDTAARELRNTDARLSQLPDNGRNVFATAGTVAVAQIPSKEELSTMSDAQLEEIWKQLVDKRDEIFKYLNDIRACLMRAKIPDSEINAILRALLGEVNLSDNMPNDPNLWDALFNKGKTQTEFWMKEIEEMQGFNDRLTYALNELESGYMTIAPPVQYEAGKEIGYVKNDFPNYASGGQHNGTDIGNQGQINTIDGLTMGPSIIAAVSGVVIEVKNNCTQDCIAGDNGGYGNYIKIRGVDGRTYIYAHLSEVDMESVKKNEFISAGTVMGQMGATGHNDPPRGTSAHLHFGIYDPTAPDAVRGYVNPRDTIVNEERIGQTICSACSITDACVLRP